METTISALFAKKTASSCAATTATKLIINNVSKLRRRPRGKSKFQLKLGTGSAFAAGTIRRISAPIVSKPFRKIMI